MDPKETIPDKAEQSQSHKRPSDALLCDVEELLKLEIPWDAIDNICSPDSHTLAETFHSTNNSNVSLLGICDSRLNEQQRERKREIDRSYRKRRKQNKEEMEKQLKVLTTENEYLKNENGSFKKDNAWMNQTLKDQTKEIDHLKNDLLQQNVLVQTLSGHLANPVRLENETLKDENDLLKSTNNLGNNVILEENVKLRLENKVLKVQIDALCGKIINYNDTKH